MLDELEAGAVEFISNKFDLDTEQIMMGTAKILQVEDSHKSDLRNLDGDINVSNTLSNMLSESQVHMKVDDHIHEDVKDDNGIANDSDHALEDVKTLVDEAICKNENILMDCVDDMSPQNNEDLSLINKDKHKSVSEGDKKHVQQAKIPCDYFSKDMERVNIRNDEDLRISMKLQYVHQTELEEGMIREVSYLLECQVKQMKEYPGDPQERDCRMSSKLLKKYQTS